MLTSEATNELSAALAKAQSAMKNAAFDKTNPHFKNRYASLAQVRDTVTPSLTANGIAVVQGVDFADAMWLVSTRLTHSSGQWIETVYPFSVADAQKMGSSLTYARRYSLSAMCGIASEEDDDAEAASPPRGEAAMTAKPSMPSVNGTAGASKNAGARDAYSVLAKAFNDASSLASLEKLYANNVTEIDALPPDWLDELRVVYSDKKSELKKAVAA